MGKSPKVRLTAGAGVPAFRSRRLRAAVTEDRFNGGGDWKPPHRSFIYLHDGIMDPV
jgi:hypothetical protein